MSTASTPSRAQPPASFHQIAEAALSLRTKLEYHYATARRGEREQQKAAEQWRERELTLIRDVIGTCDSLEDLVRMIESDAKLRKQTIVLQAVGVAMESIIAALQRWDVWRVPLVGQRYNEVVFQERPVPHPWEVVQADRSERAESAGVVRSVVRSLWVRMDGARLSVVRRGAVEY